MRAKITINQTQVLDMLRKSNPGLTNLRVEVAVPVLDGVE